MKEVQNIKYLGFRDKSTGHRLDVFFISKNHLDNTTLPQAKIKALKARGMDKYFKLYDDDDSLYYEGYFNDHLPTELCDQQEIDEFTPLNWAMADAGCTKIKYQNKITGRMEYQ